MSVLKKPYVKELTASLNMVVDAVVVTLVLEVQV